MKPGSKDRVNGLTGLCSFIVTDNKEIQSQPLARFNKGTPLYNKDTRELLIAPVDKSALHEMQDHLHPKTHAPLVHSHMYGVNQPWFLSEPRLWYIDDLSNHPELVPLDGRELTDQEATWLSEVYPGTKLATDPIKTFSTGIFENETLILKASSYSDGYFASHLFNDVLSIDNIFHQMDQWLTGSTNLSAEQSVTVSFKNDITYRPSEYWICPANGTSDALAAKRPAPKSWVFEGSNDEVQWDILDQKDEAENLWNIFTFRMFSLDTSAVYKHLRLRITSWHEGDVETLDTGLRRLYIFGRKNGVFSLPEVESPHPDFAWVVPMKNQDVGLKHEDVGDVNYTSVLPQNLPSYRLPTDGRLLQVETDSELFAAIGHQCDHLITPSSAAASDGTFTPEGEWVPEFDDPQYAAYIEMTIPEQMLGKYILDCQGKRYPREWTVEGFNGTSWDVLQVLTDILPRDFESAKNTFFIDTTVQDANYTKIRINVTQWNEGTEPLGLTAVQLFGHPVGQFYIPNITSDVEGVMPYIIRKNTANDVTAAIISDLQENIVSLTQAHALLQNRVDKLDPDIITGA